MPATPMPPVTDAIRGAVSQVAELRARADRSELDLITALRRDRWTWRSIAALLGLDSPQAAQYRHAALTRKTAAGTSPR